MPDYCSIEDIQTQTSLQTLIQLTSDEGLEEINETVVFEAILYSSTLIDGYLRGRYTLPLNTHSCLPALNGITESDYVSSVQPLLASRFPILKIIAVDLSIHRLYCRRMQDEMPEVIENNYKNAIATLKDIQKGVITLQSINDTLETSNFNADEYRTNKNLLDKLFGKQRLNEY